MSREEVEVLEEGGFYAGSGSRVLWGYRLLRFPNGAVVVSLIRTGKKGARVISFNFLELPDLIEALRKIQKIQVTPSGRSSR